MNERTSVGREKNLKPLFQFLCAFTTTAHIYSKQASKSLLIVFHPTKIYLYFAPLSFCSAPLQKGKKRRKQPDPGFDRPIFMAYTQRVFDRFFVLMVRLCETGRKGMNERRRGALYCIIFLHTHIFPSQHTKFCFVSKRKAKEERTEGK